MASTGEGFEREADAVAAIAERLADAALDLLSEAIHEDDEGRAEAVRMERELQRARRSLTKAEGILRGVSSRQDD